jgi:hypothetical protein
MLPKTRLHRGPPGRFIIHNEVIVSVNGGNPVLNKLDERVLEIGAHHDARNDIHDASEFVSIPAPLPATW